MVKKESPAAVSNPVTATGGEAVRGGTFLGWLAKHWAALLLGLIAGAVPTFFWMQYDIEARVAQLQAARIEAQQKLQTELQAAQTRAENLQGQLLIEQGTRQGLETALKGAQAELVQEREKVAFFDQLLPAGPGGSISVRGLDISRQDTILFYRVLLTRQAPANGAVFKGRLVFEAQGKQNGKSRVLPLAFITDADADAQEGQKEQAVSFEWFLRQEGYLKLPPGFSPSRLTLKVYEGKALKQTHTFDF